MTPIEELKQKITDLEADDDYDSLQIDDCRRHLILRYAKDAADDILVEMAKTPEELNYLTSAMAIEFAKKTHFITTHALMRKQLLDKMGKKDD